MTLEKGTAMTTGERVDTQKPIVVAVDGSEGNRSAVAWATGEAEATGYKVVLVNAIEDHHVPTPHFSIRSQDQNRRDMLADAQREVRHIISENDVVTEVVTGSPVEILLDRSVDAEMVVVGKRGLGRLARVILGSASIAIAGRAKVPVAVVPTDWMKHDQQDLPVVIGIDPDRVDPNPISLAFSRAQRLGVPLVAVHGWKSPAATSWDPAAVAGTAGPWERKAQADFEGVLDVWRDRFPEVEVVSVHSHSHPAMAVLDAAEHAQLVILGRHTEGKLGGFSLGSVSRAVLHYSECPVMVVPTAGS